MDAALKAGVAAGRALKVFAVEKNANAVITLRNRAIMDKWTNVTIVAKDMRDWVRGKEGMKEGMNSCMIRRSIDRCTCTPFCSIALSSEHARKGRRAWTPFLVALGLARSCLEF